MGKNNYEESQTASFSYDSVVIYDFYWTKSRFVTDISFTVSVGVVEIFSCANAKEELTEGEKFLQYWENPCEHSLPSGSSVCTKCERTCGEGFPHEFSEDHICSLCSYACGSALTPHDWSAKDGACGVCAMPCPGHEFVDNRCKTCGLTKEAKVIISGKETVCVTLEEALAAAEEAGSATVELLNNVTRNGSVETIFLNRGKINLDLNGYTIINESETTINVGSECQLTILDTSPAQTGAVKTKKFEQAIMLSGSAKLYVKGGTLQAEENVAINGLEDTEIYIEGGTIISDYIEPIFTGNMVSIRGGELVSGTDFVVALFGEECTLDISAYAEAGNVTVHNSHSISADSIKLPLGYGLLNALSWDPAEDMLLAGGLYRPELKTGVLRAGTSINICLETAGDYVVILADYENGELVKAEAVPFTGVEGGNNVNAPMDLGEGDKIFLVNSLTAMQPVAMVYHVPLYQGE